MESVEGRDLLAAPATLLVLCFSEDVDCWAFHDSLTWCFRRCESACGKLAERMHHVVEPG